MITKLEPCPICDADPIIEIEEKTIIYSDFTGDLHTEYKCTVIIYCDCRANCHHECTRLNVYGPSISKIEEKDALIETRIEEWNRIVDHLNGPENIDNEEE